MASRLCKRCNQVRTANRVCADCAAKTQCVRCGVEHGLGAQAKYCKECVSKIPCEVYHPKETRRVVSARMEWESPTYMGFTPTSHDWARLAAYIDGEGSINFSPRQSRVPGQSMTLMGRVDVTNTDIRLIQWCANTFGMGWRGKPHSPGKRSGKEQNWKPCYHATSTSFRAAWLMHNCLPWFILKRAQASILIEHQTTTVVGLWERGVARKTPQDILKYRLSLKHKLAELNRRGPKKETTSIALEA